MIVIPQSFLSVIQLCNSSPRLSVWPYHLSSFVLKITYRCAFFFHYAIVYKTSSFSPTCSLHLPPAPHVKCSQHILFLNYRPCLASIYNATLQTYVFISILSVVMFTFFFMLVIYSIRRRCNLHNLFCF